VSWRVETAAPVIAKVHKPGKVKADPLRGLFEATVDGKPAVVEYEPDADLRDTEQVPLLEEGGIEAFIRREVLPYTPDAWIKEDATKIGYEISFTRHFYKPQPLRTLEEISADILAIEKEAEGLLDGLLKVELSPLLRELPWSSHLHILSRSKRSEEREFYLRMATQNRWPVRRSCATARCWPCSRGRYSARQNSQQR
jgi:hypothetical protein